MLQPRAPQEGGFAPAGLARVEEVVRGGLGTVCPATALLVARQGSVVLHGAYGYLDPETEQRPTQPDSLFDLASLTKLFTVTAFMTLVEAGRATLGTPVADVLPEFGRMRAIGPTEDPQTKALLAADPAFVGQQIDARTVTFWHLLTHTSGLSAWRSLYREGAAGGEVPLPHLVAAEVRAQRVAGIHERYDFS